MLRKRTLRYEALEDRQLFAGDVTASVVGDELQIAGDAGANYADVQLRSISGKKMFVVVGKTFDGLFDASGNPTVAGTPTTVNGHKKAFRVDATAVKKITVTAGDGDDAIVLGGIGQHFKVSGLQVFAGLGSDFVSIKNVDVASTTNTKVQMTKAAASLGASEAGNDRLLIDSFNAKAGGLVITTGGGNDVVSLSNLGAKVVGTSTIIGEGDGNDSLTIENVGLTAFNLDGGAGNDKFNFHNASFAKSKVAGGEGNDSTTLNYLKFTDAANFYGGDGNDSLSVTTCELDKSFAFSGGDGKDFMKVFHVRFLGTLTFNGEAGNDRFGLNRARLKNVSLNGGDGNDKISILTATGNDIVVNGGNGGDAFSVTHAEVHSLTANMGTSAETDTVTIFTFRTQILNVDMGAGNNDWLNMINEIDIQMKATLNGGAGTGDRITRGPRILPGATTFTGFEAFI